MRHSVVERDTKETSISLTLTLDDECGAFVGSSGIGFLDHMLTILAVHGKMGIKLSMKGDLHIDTHHSVEDLGLVLGEAMALALGKKLGIARYGTFYCPMDEALVRTVIDFSGRPYLVYNVPLTVERVGAFETEMLREFLYAFSVKSGCNLHVTALYGTNNHHIIEGVFKSLAHAIKAAVSISSNGNDVLSTKGVL